MLLTRLSLGQSESVGSAKIGMLILVVEIGRWNYSQCATKVGHLLGVGTTLFSFDQRQTVVNGLLHV
jgi:hypothetical protein